jgi:hypothetical protein
VRWRHVVSSWVILADWLWWDLICGLRRRVLLAAPEAAFAAHDRYMLVLAPHHLIWPAATLVPRVMLTRLGRTIRLDRAMMNAHSALFQLPLIREMCIALNFRAASRDVGADGGSSVAVFPGGGLEMQRQRAGQDTVVLRRGFVSLAIERGLPIVPVYLCNETSAFVPLARFARLREWLYDLTKAGVPLWTGLGGLPLCPLPNRERYLCVIGEPIPVGAARAPSAREVDDVLADVELGMRRLHGKFAPLAGRAPGHAIVFDRSRL